MTDPTPADVDAVAEALSVPEWGRYNPDATEDHNRWTWRGDGRPEHERDWLRADARTILTSDDPAVHRALLRTLIRAGVLSEEATKGGCDE